MAFPVIVDSPTTVQATNSTSWTINVPAHNAGDILLFICGFDGAPVVNSITAVNGVAWTLNLVNTANGTANKLYAAWLRATSNQASAMTVTMTLGTTEQGVGRVWAIRGAHTTTAPAVGTAVTGSNTTPNPPSLNPAGWDVEDTMWFAAANTDAAVTATAFPSNMTTATGFTDVSGGGNGAGLHTCRHQLAGASLDPDTFTLSATETWVAQTIAIRPAPAVFTPVQVAFKFRSDNGSETAATWLAPQNTNLILAPDRNVRLRLEVEETQSASGSVGGQLEYNRNGAGWNNVTGSSSVVRSSASTHFAEDVVTTNQLTGSAKSFTAGRMDEVNGDTTNVTLNNQHTEFEYSFQVRSADVADGDTIQLRVQGLTTYAQTPTITVSFAPPTATTDAVTSIGTTTATGGGNITSGSGLTVVSRGVVVTDQRSRFGIAAGGKLGVVSGSYNQARAELEIDSLVAAGSGHLRADFPWVSGEPTQGNYAPGWGDNWIPYADAAGLGIIVTVAYSPSWVNADNRVGPSTQTQWDAYADFCAYIVDRYPYIHGIEIWNEANIHGFWRNPQSTIGNYVDMLQTAYPVIKAANPDVQVILGGTAGSATDATNFAPAAWLGAVYSNGGQGFFDAAAIHPYTANTSLNLTFEWETWDFNTGGGAQGSWLGTDSLSYPSRMTAAGDGSKPIYITEVGHIAATPSQSVAMDAYFDKLKTYSFVEWVSWYSWRVSDENIDTDIYERNYLMHSDLTPRDQYYAFAEQNALDQQDFDFAAAAGGTGTFSVSMTGLSPDTEYYARAYGESSTGFGYGPVELFQTAAPSGPYIAWVGPLGEASNATEVDVEIPSGQVQADDIIVIAGLGNESEAVFQDIIQTGWNTLRVDPWDRGGTGGGDPWDQGSGIYWKRAVGNEGGTFITVEAIEDGVSPIDPLMAFAFGIRGAHNTGSPFAAVAYAEQDTDVPSAPSANADTDDSLALALFHGGSPGETLDLTVSGWTEESELNSDFSIGGYQGLFSKPIDIGASGAATAADKGVASPFQLYTLIVREVAAPGASSDTTQAVRLTGQVASDHTQAIRLTSQVVSDHIQFVRVTAQATSTLEQAIRLTSQAVSDHTQAVRITGQDTLTLEQAIRLASEASLDHTQSVRVAGDDASVSHIQAMQLTAEASLIVEYSLRVTGQDTSLDERAVRLTAEAISDYNQGIRIVAQADSSTESAISLIGTQPQFLRPVSDVTAGGWTVEPLYEKIDETIADDNDYITSPSLPSSPAVAEVALTPGNPVASLTDHTVRYRFRKRVVGGSGVMSLTVTLLDGSTEIASWAHSDVIESWVDAEQELTTEQADNITDYGNLRLRFAAVEGPLETEVAVTTGAMLNESLSVSDYDVRSVYISYNGGTTWEETYSQSPSLPAAQGKMVTARMVQAAFFNSGSFDQSMDDADADANTQHFIDQMPAYRASGVLCWVVSLEGGNPINQAADPNIDQTGFSYRTNADGATSVFLADGTGFKTGRIERVEALIEAAAEQGMIVCLALFYSRQAAWLATQADYRNAMETVTDWLITKGYKNVVIDLANEAGADLGGNWTSNAPDCNFLTDAGVAEEIAYFKSLWDGQPWRPAIGCSSRSKPGQLTMDESDIHWFHGNVAGTPTSSNPANRDNWVQDMLNATTVGPVVCNEDETSLEENGPSSGALAIEICCFDGVNDIAGASGGTMLASTWQRWHSDQPTPFLPEPGASSDPDTGTYWERYRNFTRAWLDHVESQTGGLAAP